MKKSIKKLAGFVLGVVACLGAVQVQAYSIHDDVNIFNNEKGNTNIENSYLIDSSPLLKINNVQYIPLNFLEFAGYYAVEADDTGKVLYVEDGHYMAQITIGSSLASPYMFIGELFDLGSEVLKIGNTIYVPINFQSYLHNINIIDRGNSVTMYRDGLEIATLYNSGKAIVTSSRFSTIF